MKSPSSLCLPEGLEGLGGPGAPTGDRGCKLEQGERFAPRKYHLPLLCLVFFEGVVCDLPPEIVFTEYWVDTALQPPWSRTGVFASGNWAVFCCETCVFSRSQGELGGFVFFRKDKQTEDFNPCWLIPGTRPTKKLADSY